MTCTKKKKKTGHETTTQDCRIGRWSFVDLHRCGSSEAERGWLSGVCDYREVAVRAEGKDAEWRGGSYTSCGSRFINLMKLRLLIVIKI